jgi:hypothetical protein
VALENLFASFKGDGQRSYDPADPDSYDEYISEMIRDSRDYEGSILAAKRDYLQKYYYGMLPTIGRQVTNELGAVQPDATFGELLNEDTDSANRSSFVSTDVRDAIMLMMPALIRLFAASENVVSLIPRSMADVDAAEQQTQYINYVFWQDNPGFLILYGAFKDAMTVRTGFVKWWSDNTKEVKRKTFVNINDQQIQTLLQIDQTAKIVHQGEKDPLTEGYDKVVFSYEVDKPLIKIAGVPPEEMRLDRWARSFATSRIVGHERIVSVDELVGMGYDRDECVQYIEGQMTPEFTSEPQIRNPGRYSSATRVGDGVRYGEWYIKADKDGDGHAELRYICTMGTEYKVVNDEEANRIKFACFAVDPISHTIVGDSVADYVEDVQRIKTNMMRGVLDSLAESINPKTVINELTTNLDDALNDDLGAVIRTRGDPSAAVFFTQTPFVGQAAMPVVDLLNDVLARRTGLTDAAKGLDPKALQSSTSIGVEAIINGAQERVELTARVLAETGFKELFTGLYNEIAEAPNQRRTLRLAGKWTDIDTGTFDASMGVEVNSTLGKGSDTVRMMTLQQIKTDQMAVFQQFGPQNPVVGIPEMINTITDMLAIANIKNPGRYFKTPDPNTLAQIAQQPKQPDAMTIAAMSQQEKVRSDSSQAVGEQQLQAAKQMQDDAFRHEQLRQKTAYDNQKIAIERAKVGVAARQAGQPEAGPDPIEGVKVAADLHKHSVDTAMEGQKQQLDFATDQAKIQQAREAAALQAQTSMAQAAMKPPPGSGPGGNGQ